MKNAGFCLILLFVTLICVTPGLGRPIGEDFKQKAAAIKQSPAGNQAAIRQYQWIETTQVMQQPKDAVQLNVSFATLSDGTSHAGQTVLDLPAKEMKIVIRNRDYKKAGR